MPPAYVKIVREEIYYEYAKLISRSAHGSLQYGFVTDRFKKKSKLKVRHPVGSMRAKRTQSIKRINVLESAQNEMKRGGATGAATSLRVYQ